MPLLSIEFAVFFIAFLPIYWAFFRMPSVQNVLLLLAGMGWVYHLNPIFAAVIACYSSCVHLLAAPLTIVSGAGIFRFQAVQPRE